MLNEKHREAYVALAARRRRRPKTKKLSRNDDEAYRLRDFMCDNFFDIRTFGAVMCTKINAGQVRGPVQIGFATSVEPCCRWRSPSRAWRRPTRPRSKERQGVMDEPGDEKRGDNRTMGRKHIIPYGLYRAHGFVSRPWPHDARKGTGFSDEDLELLWQALADMFEHDRSAARGEMTTRKLIVFRHASALGNARAGDLFGRITVWRGEHLAGAAAGDNLPPARSFADYDIKRGRMMASPRASR